jgi:hypothetical protein
VLESNYLLMSLNRVFITRGVSVQDEKTVLNKEGAIHVLISYVSHFNVAIQ